MMNLGTVIGQIKTYVPSLGGRVSGAADFASGLEGSVNMTLPAAYVLPLEDAAGENDLWPGVNQIVTERMGIVVEFDNTVDTPADRRTGYAGVNQVYATRSLLFSAILNWLPDDMTGIAARGFRYGGGRMVDFDRARLFWQFEFLIDITVTDGDGFPISGEPIISGIGTIQPSGDPGGAPPVTIEFIVP